MTIRVVTDSGADLPSSVRDEYAITLVPLSVRFGDEEFIDQETLTTEEFWAKIPTANPLPETAAPSAGKFEETFRALHADGASGIVCVNLSGALSATLQAATLGARAVEGVIPVSVIDSKNVSLGQSMLVERAGELAELGHDLPSITADLERARERTELFGLLDTLEFLHKGGRIGAAKKLLGSMLSIKPIICTENGVVGEAGKVRTRAKGIAFLLDQLRDKDLDRVAVLHSQAPDVDEFAAQVTELIGRAPMINCLGPIVGTHAGPGAIGIAYISSE